MAFGEPRITEVEQIVDTNPDLYLRRAEDALRRGDIQASLRECDQAISYSNGSSHYVFEKAKILNHMGSFSSCIDVIQRHLQQFKQELDQYKLGEVFLYLFYSYKNENYENHGSYFVAGYQQNYAKAKEGFGVYFFPNGDTYVGQWKDYKQHGYGTLFSGATLVYSGRWDKGKKYNIFRVFFRRTLKLLLLAVLLYIPITYNAEIKGWLVEQFSSDGIEEYDYQDEGEEYYYRYLTVTAEAANIRELPDLNSAIVTEVIYNEQLLYLEEEQYDIEDRLWYRVQTDTGYEGWISSKIVQGLDEISGDVVEEEATEEEFMEEESVDSYQAEIDTTGYMEYQEIYYDDAFYRGETYNGEPHGQGIVSWPSGTYYEGQFENGSFHGNGTLSYDDGSVYSGEFYYDQRDGQGTLTFADGSVYEGYFLEDQRTGYGKMTWTDGYVYEGDFVDGNMEGYGVLTYPDGSYYEGEFYNNQIVE